MNNSRGIYKLLRLREQNLRKAEAELAADHQALARATSEWQNLEALADDYCANEQPSARASDLQRFRRFYQSLREVKAVHERQVEHLRENVARSSAKVAEAGVSKLSLEKYLRKCESAHKLTVTRRERRAVAGLRRSRSLI